MRLFWFLLGIGDALLNFAKNLAPATVLLPMAALAVSQIDEHSPAWQDAGLLAFAAAALLITLLTAAASALFAAYGFFKALN